MTSYYQSQPRERIAATAKLVRWYRAFIRSDCTLARIPDCKWRETMTREQAQSALIKMVQRAINGKLEPREQPRGRKDDCDQQIRYRRDQRRLQDIANRVRVYQFETSEVAQRFSHLLARYDD